MSSGDFLRIEIYSCESLHIICTGGSKVCGGDGSEEIISCTVSAYSWPGERLEYDPLW